MCQLNRRQSANNPREAFERSLSYLNLMSVVARGIGIVEAWITVLDGKLASYDESILSYDSEEDLDGQDVIKALMPKS